MFKKILIANRGDVALRVLRACREMNIPNVVVHSTADADSMPVRLADESVCIGPPSSAASYLNVASIITAAGITGADAVHPGVGFLAENADFAEIVAAHGLTFIGPEPRHIRSMGDKVEAKITAADSGLPLVPGSPENPHLWDDEMRHEAAQMILEGTELEVQYARATMPRGILGMNANMMEEYLQFIANRRLVQIGLEEEFVGATNPFPWMSEIMDLRKEKNFFETRVIEYQTGGALNFDE